MPYPIIEEVQLDEVRRGLFRRTRRDVGQLPRQRPGTVLVFQVSNRYVIAPGQRLRGDEPVVVDAASVSVVDVRQRMVPVRLELPSANPANVFAVRVTFSCRVREAETVVATHADMMEDLASYLRQDRQLRALANGYTLEELADARDALSAQIEARFSLKPVELEGVEVLLGDVDVLTPKDLIDFERSRQELNRNQILEMVHRDFDRSQAALIEDILNRGPQAVEALAIRLGEVSLGNATIRSYGEDDKSTGRLLEMLTNLASYGHADQVPIDTALIIDKIVAKVAGDSQSVTFRDTALPLGDPATAIGRRATSQEARSNSGKEDDDWRGSSEPQDVDDDDF
ncbi:SPFH domain-containing protein [Micromonospora sp. NPDC005205]|uniref:SPFH domain-containing protein n=1 Tax=Micromonospora sp. NPDC005205 TaxID=3156714 RepID=UPI0033A3E435